jgi:hypothetical protein
MVDFRERQMQVLAGEARRVADDPRVSRHARDDGSPTQLCANPRCGIMTRFKFCNECAS